MSTVAAMGFVDPQWPSRLGKWINGTSLSDEDATQASDSPLRPRRFRGTGNSSGLGRGETLLVIESDKLFTYQGAEALREIVDDLNAQPTISSVTWLDNAPPLNIFGLPEPVIPRGKASEQRFEVAADKAVKNPLIVGQLLSADARTTIISIGFNWPFVTTEAQCSTELVERAKSIAQKYPDLNMEISATGPVPIRLMLVADRVANEVKYQLIAYGIILTMAIVLFRGLTVVVVVALAPVTGVLWTLGILRYFDLQDNPFSDVIVPVLVSLVGFTDAVHMMVFLRGQLKRGAPAIRACRNMLAAVGLACFLTSLTTAIGMGSLLWAHHEIVREFGCACVIGVVCVFLSVMTIIPLACYTPWSRRLSRGTDSGWVERNLDLFAGGVTAMLRFPKIASFGAVALLVGLALFAMQLRPDDKTSNLMPTGSEAQLTLAKLDNALGGLDLCRVEIDWKDAKDQQSPESIASLINKVDQILESEPLIGHPLSVCKLLKAMPGEDPPEEKMSMVELLPPQLKQAVFDAAEHQATVSFRAKDLGTATYKPVFERVEAELAEVAKQYPGVSIEMAGAPVWKWKELYQIVVDLVKSLASASFVIFVVLGLAFKSFRIGLISTIPNLLPLAAAASFLVLIGKPLEMVSVCALTICLGIAVDDTIHFITRYQEEQLGTGSRKEKIRRAFHGVGSGLIMTSIVLVAGFGSVLTSSVPEHRTFAQMGVVTLVSALLCDLYLLPGLLYYFDKDPVDSQS